MLGMGLTDGSQPTATIWTSRGSQEGDVKPCTTMGGVASLLAERIHTGTMGILDIDRTPLFKRN